MYKFNKIPKYTSWPSSVQLPGLSCPQGQIICSTVEWKKYSFYVCGTGNAQPYDKQQGKVN